MLKSPKEIFDSLPDWQQSSLTRELSQADQTAFHAWMVKLEDPDTRKTVGTMVKIRDGVPCFCAQGAGLAVFYPDLTPRYFAGHANANSLLLGLKVPGIEPPPADDEETLSERRSSAFFWTIVHLNDSACGHLDLPLPVTAKVLKHARAQPYDAEQDVWPT